jgi:3',5'-cyclic AMP phosphodiesterase CpdA
MRDFTRKLIVMTDIHIMKPGRKIIGLDPSERFRACLAHAAANHPDADGLILMGDLVHHGVAEQYAQFKSLLDGLPWPVHMTIGNHDIRETFQTVFPDAPKDENGFVQQSISFGDHTLLMMDTNDPTTEPYHGGNLCRDRLSWLSAQLAGKARGSVVIAMHHPPFTTGFPGMDDIGLQNREAFNSIVDESPAVAMVMAGHVHRTIWGSAGGKPCAVLKSPCHQMPMELDQANSSLSVDEPGAYGVLLLGPHDPVLLTEDVGLDSPVAEDGDSR